MNELDSQEDLVPKDIWKSSSVRDAYSFEESNQETLDKIDDNIVSKDLIDITASSDVDEALDRYSDSAILGDGPHDDLEEPKPSRSEIDSQSSSKFKSAKELESSVQSQSFFLPKVYKKKKLSDTEIALQILGFISTFEFFRLLITLLRLT